MKTFCRPRQCGKTYDLIKRCAAEGGYIVCYNQKEAERVHHMSKCMNLDIPLPITFMDFILNHYYDKGVKKFHIDNVDLCLQMFSQVPISTITLTNTENFKKDTYGKQT